MNDILVNRFIKYVKIDTQSDEHGEGTPSTKKQFDLGNVILAELKELGLEAILTDKCIVYGYLKANEEGHDPIGFISHLDTSPEASGKNVNPQFTYNYDGGIIKLNENILLDSKVFPSLNRCIGKTIIHTDGTTLLGADDKAGDAEIMTMIETIVKNNIPHGDIYVAFTPDEEIGGGIATFDLNTFKAKYAFTVDGGSPEIINYENFNAASAVVHIQGVEVHPGDAKDKMINAIQVGRKFLDMLPENMRPEYTFGYDGFNHCLEFNGTTSEATLVFILRNHDLEKLQKQKEDFKSIQTALNNLYGRDVVSVDIKDSYFNMKELIKEDMTSVNVLNKAIKECNLDPIVEPIRGGTDGAKLTQMGLKTPNIGTGGYNYHGKYEYACVEEMEKMLEILLKIVEIC